MSLLDLYIAKKMSGGGGGSDYTLLGSKEYEVSTTSTSATNVGTFNVPGSYTKDSIIYIKVRDKAGKRNGYFRGNDYFCENHTAANGETNTIASFAKAVIGVDSNGKFAQTNVAYGVYPDQISSGGNVVIKAKYSSSYGTIDGTYVVEVYALKWPNDDSPFK